MDLRKPKVLLIGWDGADWEHINPLMDAGLLPTLSSFVDQGTIANLATLQPVLSPMLWNSVATGKFADKHGIYGFVEPDNRTGAARPFSSASRKTKALWNIFSQSGIRSNVINWWASHPAEKINGAIVSNLFGGVKFVPNQGWSIAPGTVHPAQRAEEWAKLKMFWHELSEEHILPFVPNAASIDQEKDKRLISFARVFSEMMTTHSVATEVMEAEPWDFMAIYYTAIDHFAHGFMPYHPPQMPYVTDEDFEMYKGVMTAAYRFHDMMLERLLQLSGDDTTVVICSDHGFQSGEFRPHGMPREPMGPVVWHRQYGMLAVKGPGIKKDERIYGASLIDIGPTILSLYGLPIGEDMDGRPLVEIFEEPPEIETIPSWDDVEGDHGMHSGEEESMSDMDSEELLKQFVALGYVDDQGGDKAKQFKSAEMEGKYNLAGCLMWQGRYEEARLLLEELLFLTPWETRFIIQLADCYFRAGYLKQAEELIQRSFVLEETGVNKIIVIYAKLKIALGEPEEGIPYLLSVLKREPRSPKISVQVGDAFAGQRKWKNAETAYLRALEKHPDMARAYEGISTVYLRTGRNQEAMDAALNAVGLLHRLPKSHFNLGVALARSEDFERAELAFQTAARFAPRWANPHRLLSVVYEKLGKHELAAKHQRESFSRIEDSKTERDERIAQQEQRFPLPEILPEAERAERIVKERPSSQDPVEKSGKTFVLVSGLPRSGTSLMMQMLSAGGMQPLTDEIRGADEDNPRGYFEWEDIKKIDEKPELLDPPELDGRVIKVISMLLNKMPKQHDYKVIFMQRSVAEVAASQQKMIDRLGTDGAKMELQELERGLAAHRRATLDWLSTVKHMEMLEVKYSELIDDPDAICAKLKEFLGDRLSDSDKMSSAIDRSLYRNREEK